LSVSSHPMPASEFPPLANKKLLNVAPQTLLVIRMDCESKPGGKVGGCLTGVVTQRLPHVDEGLLAVLDAAIRHVVFPDADVRRVHRQLQAGVHLTQLLGQAPRTLFTLPQPLLVLQPFEFGRRASSKDAKRE